MLFDLRGKRKRLVQVVYMILAVLFGASLLIITPTGDNILSSFGGGDGSADSAFDQSIEDAQKRVDQNPKSAAAWAELARTKLALSNSAEGFDPETGAPTDKGQQAAVDGTDAWQRYLRLNKGKPADPAVAQFAANGYANLGDAPKAMQAQELVVEERPDQSTAWSQLALFAYASGRDEAGDKAQAKAIALVPKDQRNTIKSTLEEQEKQGKKFYREVQKAKKEARKQQKQQGEGTSGGESFGPLPGQGSQLGTP